MSLRNDIGLLLMVSSPSPLLAPRWPGVARTRQESAILVALAVIRSVPLPNFLWAVVISQRMYRKEACYDG